MTVKSPLENSGKTADFQFEMSGERGIRTLSDSPVEMACFAVSGAESGALTADPAFVASDLALLIDRWSALPEAVRAGIMAMVEATASFQRRVPIGVLKAFGPMWPIGRPQKEAREIGQPIGQ